MQPATHTYQGFASHAALGADEVGGSIVVDLHNLRFESDAASAILALENLNLAQDDAGRIAFCAASAPGWLVSTSDERILKDYFIVRRNHLRSQAREVRQRKEGGRVLKYAGTFIVAFSLLALVGWMLSSATVSFLVREIPVAWEKELADSALKKHRKFLKPVDNPKLAAKVRPLVKRLEAALPEHTYQFEVEIVDNPLPNAVALPGGKILVFEGLFDAAQTPEELAGVLAHEMAHVNRRHGLRTIITASGPYYVLRLFIRDRQSFLALVSAGSELLVQQQYSRRLEAEADDLGWHYLEAVNIDPRGLASFLRKEEANEAAIRSSLPSFFTNKPLALLRSHPETAERLARLDKLWQHAKRKSGFVNLREDGNGS